jgi:hypothetical protein
MELLAEADACSAAVDAAKLFEKVRRWCPSAPVEVPITSVKSFIEAAASGGLGQLRWSSTFRCWRSPNCRARSNVEKTSGLI